MEPIRTIPPDVARKLGYYIYAYVNPLDRKIFYVGKGKGRRVLRHLEDRAETRKVAMIKQIRATGREPQLEILAHGLRSADAALQVEAAVIDALGLPFLTNRVRGWRSLQYGRTPLPELIAKYRRRPVRVLEPSMLIRINDLYRPQMSASELYDATRTAWPLGRRREHAKYALAVFEGIVREVYEITQWLPAGATFNSPRPARCPGRWEVGVRGPRCVGEHAAPLRKPGCELLFPRPLSGYLRQRSVSENLFPLLNLIVGHLVSLLRREFETNLRGEGDAYRSAGADGHAFSREYTIIGLRKAIGLGKAGKKLC